MRKACGLCFAGLLFLLAEDAAAFQIVRWTHAGGILPEQIFLAACQPLRDGDIDGDKLIAAYSFAVQVRNTLSFQAENRAGFCTFRDREFHFSFQRGYFNVRTEDGLRVGNILCQINTGALAFKQCMRTYNNGDINVACRAAVRSGIAFSRQEP